MEGRDGGQPIGHSLATVSRNGRRPFATTKTQRHEGHHKIHLLSFTISFNLTIENPNGLLCENLCDFVPSWFKTRPLSRELFLEAFGLELGDEWFEQEVEIAFEDLP